jgi:hypothetical protein
MTSPAAMEGGGIATFRAVQRRLAEVLAVTDSHFTQNDASEALFGGPAMDPPRLAQAAPIEGAVISRRKIEGSPEVGFSAFLDGTQISRVVLHDDGIPIVHGAVGAVVRQRTDRRLSTWKVETEGRLYAPLAFLSPAANAAMSSLGIGVSDTTPRKQGGEVDEEGRHPLALTDVAVSAVQAHREQLEIQLAESWLREGGGPLFVDGGISGSAQLAASNDAIGVVKRHRTLYGDPAAVRTILKLTAGERSTVFAVESPNRWRATIASWYLRLRDGADPLWGLVRVETRMPAAGEKMADRVNEISRWILAESAPLALPDGRWDTLVYGIRDCGQYLQSVMR